MNPTDVKSLIDGAANQSDRWLFVALLVIGILVVGYLFKYFTGQISNIATKNDETNKFVREELASLVGEAKAVIAANTDIMREFMQREKYGPRNGTNHEKRQ